MDPGQWGLILLWTGPFQALTQPPSENPVSPRRAPSCHMTSRKALPRPLPQFPPRAIAPVRSTLKSSKVLECAKLGQRQLPSDKMLGGHLPRPFLA